MSRCVFWYVRGGHSLTRLSAVDAAQHPDVQPGQHRLRPGNAVWLQASLSARGAAHIPAPPPFDVCSLDVEALLLAKQFSMPVAELTIEGHEVGGGNPNVVTDSVHAQRPRYLGWRDYTAAVTSCSFMTVCCGLQIPVLFQVIEFKCELVPCRPTVTSRFIQYGRTRLSWA